MEDKKRGINDLPDALLAPIEHVMDVRPFLECLHDEGLAYHADDDAVDCLHRGDGPLSELAAKFVGWQVRDARAVLGRHHADIHEMSLQVMLERQ